MPDGIQMSEIGQVADEAISHLDQAMSSLEAAIDDLQGAIEL